MELAQGSRIEIWGDVSLCSSHPNPLLQFLKSCCPLRSDRPRPNDTFTPTPRQSSARGEGFGVLRRLVLVCVASPFPPWKLLPRFPLPPRYVSPKAKAARWGRGWNRPDRSAGARGAERGNPPAAQGGCCSQLGDDTRGPQRSARSAPSWRVIVAALQDFG